VGIPQLFKGTPRAVPDTISAGQRASSTTHNNLGEYQVETKS
jgi:hypothetical protein